MTKIAATPPEDEFLGGRIVVMQPETGHRAGSDAVWLAAAVPAVAGEHVLDAGAGVGVAGLCLLARVPAARSSCERSASSVKVPAGPKYATRSTRES